MSEDPYLGYNFSGQTPRRKPGDGLNSRGLPGGQGFMTQNYPFKEQRHLGYWVSAALVARTVQRHHQVTGDWEMSLKAGSRAALRWSFFWPLCGFVFVGGIAALCIISFWLFGAVTDPWGMYGTTVPSTYAVVGTIASIVASAATFLLTIPYCVGVLWVRYADRCLFRVNHLRIYRWLHPFAYRMRRVPDVVLYYAPFFLPWIVMELSRRLGVGILAS
jgi:hypothetical protein